MSALRVRTVFHPREKLGKCTLWPLVERFGFEHRVFPDVGDTEGCLLLAPDGEPLAARDRAATLVLVDGTWRYAARMAASLRVPRRSLPGFVSAYPRTSKLFRDPPGGLASAEALYAASLLLGEEEPRFLDGYRWREAFLRRNRRRIEELRGGQESP